MIKKITIATLSVLLFASLLFTFISPLIPAALDIRLKDWGNMVSTLFIFGLIISFVFATILFLICEFWKVDPKKELD